MKCITICNPYLNLIFLPPSDPQFKRTENRRFFPFTYRGPLLIHAGKSRDYMAGNTYGILESEMAWGAIVGVVDLIDVVKVTIRPTFPNGRSNPCKWTKIIHPKDKQKYHWLAEHCHAHGPNCLILDNPRKFHQPIPYRGRQGLFDVPVMECDGWDGID